MTDWKIFLGDVEPHDGIKALPAPPPWRDVSGQKEPLSERRGRTFRPSEHEIGLVNAALFLRRPLLVTGPPGSGKSSLAYAVARELKLGPPLVWPINSRSTLAEGLYRYDALGRLRDAQRAGSKPADADADIGTYLSLGPLGTALARSLADRPRVLLIDEIDKSDIDLANDLLHVFEEGSFEIPELVRIANRSVLVRPCDSEAPLDQIRVENGRIRCQAFPFTVLTSNGERDLPPAFLRRCLRLDMTIPDEERLKRILLSHLPDLKVPDIERQLAQFLKAWKEGKVIATDQLLNALYLMTCGRAPQGTERDGLVRILMRELGGG